MTGPLANEFAQVRSLLMLHCDCDSAAECENTDAALAALARIEEHTHNTEKALREIEALLPVGYQAKDIARAALSAGEGTPA